MKSAACEIAEQLGWSIPDCIVTAAGGCGLLVGLHLGFTELPEAGITKSVPRLVGSVR